MDSGRTGLRTEVEKKVKKLKSEHVSTNNDNTGLLVWAHIIAGHINAKVLGARRNVHAHRSWLMKDGTVSWHRQAYTLKSLEKNTKHFPVGLLFTFCCVDKKRNTSSRLFLSNLRSGLWKLFSLPQLNVTFERFIALRLDGTGLNAGPWHTRQQIQLTLRS
jgi:hypothetical protein